MPSLLQRLRSVRHRFWFGFSEKLRWSRGMYSEAPARELPPQGGDVTLRIGELRTHYGVQFERQLSAETSINNYEYLDILDSAWRQSGLPAPRGGTVCDVGCANFWYAAALHAFFRPQRLIGIDIEGHRLYRDGHTRVDYAAGYAAALPNTEFRVADFGSCRLPADVITAWFPFVTPAAILAWRLPLSLLDPQRLFRRIRENLNPGGIYVMVNHGLDEAALADDLCVAAGFRPLSRWMEPGPFSRRRRMPPVFSVWAVRVNPPPVNPLQS